MLKHNEIKRGSIINIKGDPYEVTKAAPMVKGRGKSVNQTQLKNLRNGSVLQKTFHPGESVEEAEVEKKDLVFGYRKKDEFIFHEKDKPQSRMQIEGSILGGKQYYLKEKELVTAVVFEEDVIGINLPVKMLLKVKEAPPGVKGDRAEGGTKLVTLETGKKINVPLFIKEGDVVEINTESEEYIRRA